MNHTSVLLDEAVTALISDPDGCYVDCTFGRGGHSKEILSRLRGNGRLLVIDRDQQAIDYARELFAEDSRVMIEHGNYADLARISRMCGITGFDGILVDLGVSSPQLDDPERGFSFMRDGPLDMRMDQSVGSSVGDFLKTASAEEIEHILRRFGEERFARRIARKIVLQRQEKPLETTGELARLISDAVPRKDPHKHPATRSFQALRIFINEELQQLQGLLDVVVDLLWSGGRLVVISFHSLEDRMVKRFIRQMEKRDPFPSKFPIKDAELVRLLKRVGKPIKAGSVELSRNARSRSAVMRVAEKL